MIPPGLFVVAADALKSLASLSLGLTIMQSDRASRLARPGRDIVARRLSHGHGNLGNYSVCTPARARQVDT